MPRMIKLTEWADKHGLSYLTANRHFHAGMIPGAVQLESGTILVEEDTPEQTMIGNMPNDAISLFLKKTVEFSKNNATVEDFAAYVISNFQLKLNIVSESPRYTKQKPKSEDIQKHFQQFIPKNDKPKPIPNSFIMGPEDFDSISTVSAIVNREDLSKDFSQAVDYGSLVAPRTYLQDIDPTLQSAIADTGAMGFTEDGTTQSVDVNTTPQTINYTGSNSSVFGSPLTSSDVFPNASAYVMTATATASNSAMISSLNPNVVPIMDLNAITWVGQSTYTGQFQPTQKELESVKIAAPENKLAQPRGKRGRKPSKK